MQLTYKDNSRESLIKQYFSSNADIWQALYSGSGFQSFMLQQTQRFVLELVDSLNLPDEAEVLDLGCGTGVTTFSLLELGFGIKGIDFSDRMLELAVDNCSEKGMQNKADFRFGDAEDLEFIDNSFDLVIAVGLLEYLRWDRWALQEIHRVLKPGAHLIFTASNRFCLTNLTNPGWILSGVNMKAKHYIGKGLGWGTVGNSAKNNHTLKNDIERFRTSYVLSRLKKILTALDYEIIKINSFGFGNFWFSFGSNRLSFSFNRFFQRVLKKKTTSIKPMLGNDLIVLCKKAEKPQDINKRQIFRNADVLINDYQTDYKSYFQHCDNWLKTHPQYAHTKVEAIEKYINIGDNILIVSPHPDDEAIGCGGTMIKLLARGNQVTVLQMTDGSSTAALENVDDEIRRNVRMKEAAKVVEFIGISELILWREPDGQLCPRPDNIIKMKELLERTAPRIIFVPFVNDPHPDHIAANRIMRYALEDSGLDLNEVRIMCYEVWSVLPSNCICDISSEFERKTTALMKYKIAMRVVDYVHYCEQNNAYRHRSTLGKNGYAEAFFSVTAREYIELVD
ncbi:MAG: methyltransferase domain-containing protein [Candidatus Hatepunaea meridiana]|nr:methyltransferase domain-containing protein [Candidatus Hatepunaea meridiana]